MTFIILAFSWRSCGQDSITIILHYVYRWLNVWFSELLHDVELLSEVGRCLLPWRNLWRLRYSCIEYRGLAQIKRRHHLITISNFLRDCWSFWCKFEAKRHIFLDIFFPLNWPWFEREWRFLHQIKIFNAMTKAKRCRELWIAFFFFIYTRLNLWWFTLL